TGDRGRGGGPRTGWPGGRAVKFGGRGPIHLSAWSARILRFGKPACAVSFSARAFSAVITDLLDHRLLRRFTRFLPQAWNCAPVRGSCSPMPRCACSRETASAWWGATEQARSEEHTSEL